MDEALMQARMGLADWVENYFEDGFHIGPKVWTAAIVAEDGETHMIQTLKTGQHDTPAAALTEIKSLLEQYPPARHRRRGLYLYWRRYPEISSAGRGGKYAAYCRLVICDRLPREFHPSVFAQHDYDIEPAMTLPKAADPAPVDNSLPSAGKPDLTGMETSLMNEYEARMAMDRDLGPMPDADRVRAALQALYEEVDAWFQVHEGRPIEMFVQSSVTRRDPLFAIARGLVRMKHILDEDVSD